MKLSTHGCLVIAICPAKPSPTGGGSDPTASAEHSSGLSLLSTQANPRSCPSMTTTSSGETGFICIIGTGGKSCVCVRRDATYALLPLSHVRACYWSVASSPKVSEHTAAVLAMAR